MAENLNTGLTVEAWAEITIKEWIKKAAALGIAPGHPLNAERFVHHIITNADGEPQRIEFMYDYYLNFVDWGVGRGVSLENRDKLAGIGAIKRRKKPWYTDVFYHEIRRLTGIITEKYSMKAVKIVVTNAIGNAKDN